MFEYFSRHPYAWEQYNKTARDKGFSHGVPKERLLVKMKDDATPYEIEIVATGIAYAKLKVIFRNCFRNDLTLVINSRELNETAQKNLDILVVFLIIVAIIAITLAFFLLLLSNISNIRENVWEFGILRYVLSKK